MSAAAIFAFLQTNLRGRRTAASFALGWLLAISSGHAGEAAAKNSTSAGPGATQPMDLNTALSVSFTLPRLVVTGVMGSRSMVTEAVYFATAQTGAATYGQVARTGTITMTPYGAKYSPMPHDKLVVREATGRVHEFEGVEAAGGQGAESAMLWLLAPHRLKYLHRVTGEAEATVTEEFNGRDFAGSVTGWAVLQGKRFTVELTLRGGTAGVSDYDGADKETLADIGGMIKGEGLALEVHERHYNHFASAVSLRTLPSMRGSANQFRSTIGNVLEFGGDKYRFNHVQVETGNREKGGQPVSAGVYAVAGTILRNDQPFAECVLNNGIPVAVAGGRAIPLQGK